MVEKSTSDFSRFVKRFSLSLNALNDVKDTSLQHKKVREDMK